MAAATGGRTLEETPTWAVAVVCIALVLISIVIEHIIHLIGQWLRKKRKTALYEALEKIKSELMLLGFISLLLTVGQGLITNICISEKVGSTWHPCSKKQEERLHSNYDTSSDTHDRRKLLSSVDDGTFRRVLAAAATGDKCAAKGKVPFVSAEGIHQLHIFIFVLAIFHVLNCIFTMALGRAKMTRWKAWERETRTAEYQLHESLRYMGETSFGRRHLNLWTNKPLLMWIVCFFRHFVRLVSVAKVDYLTLRHGFITAHLAPQSHTYFDFHKYIKRSLEDDFKVVVGISPLVWFLAVVFLLSNTHGWYSHLWLPFIPLIITVLVGTKLQAIVTKMGLKIEERGEIVKGVPVVQPGDDLFWFNRPRLMLYLINFILFQNAFQLAFFTWTWYQFGIKSCFHDRTVEILIRISIGVLVQFLCSYITLPLYALVTQMGSTMKPSIFNERVTMALRNWHKSARKHIRESRRGGSRSMTPTSSQPSTPSCHAYLTWHRQSSVEGHQTSPRRSSFDVENETVDTLSLTDLEGGDDKPSSSSTYGHRNGARQEDEDRKGQEPVLSDTFIVTINEYESEYIQHETEIESKEHVPETLPPTIPSQEGYRASTSSDQGNIPRGGEDGECQEPAILANIEPVSESPSMQHEIDIGLVEFALASKGLLRDGRKDYQEIELVDGLNP